MNGGETCTLCRLAIHVVRASVIRGAGGKALEHAIYSEMLYYSDSRSKADLAG